jgi:DNA-binding GntR family transcriptional regulator
MDDTSKTLSQLAYDRLKAMLISGELRPGERLGERELARRIEVSRTPLREALSRLERDGLAIVKPGRGYFALEFDAKTIEEMYELRELLEIHASRLAARKIGSDGLAALEDIMGRLAVFESEQNLSLGQLREEAHLGLRIHEVIAQECGNDLISATLHHLYDRLRLLTWIDVLWFDKWAVTRREHLDLVEAVMSRDEDRAAELARQHVCRCRDDVLWVIKAQRGEGSRVERPKQDALVR